MVRAEGAAAEASRRGFPALHRFLPGIGRLQIVVFAAAIGLGVWSWLAYVVRPDQDFPVFTIVFCAVNALGALVQAVYLVYVRGPGSLRARLTLRAIPDIPRGAAGAFWAPPVVFGLVFLAVTPASTPTAGFDPELNIYQVIGITVLLCLCSIAVGGMAVFCLVVLPIAWLLAAVIPDRDATDSGEPEIMSRGEYLFGGLIIVFALGFGIAMNAVIDTYGDSRTAMMTQFLALVTLRGDPAASIAAVCFVAGTVVATLLARRAGRRRQQGDSRDDIS